MNPLIGFSSSTIANNYAIAYATSTTGVISPASLKVTGSKVYDSTTGFTMAELSVNSPVAGETVSLTGGAGTSSSANVGTYTGANTSLSGLTINVTGSNTLASNYSLPSTGTLGIGQETVFIRAVTNTKTYDGTTSAAATPVVAFGQFYSIDGATLGETYATANVGNKIQLTPKVSFSPTGGAAGASNYNVVAVVEGDAGLVTGVINPATLSYVANATAMTYGGAIPALSGAVTGFVNGETAQSATTGAATFTTSATSASNVGNYAITGSGLAANNGDYVFAQAASNATSLTINPATLTITANNQSKTYGQAANLGTTAFTESGLVTVNGDSVSGVTLSSPGAVGSATVGTYALSASNATGLGLSNYTIVYNNAPVGLTVDPATLTIIAGNNSKTYGTTASLGTTAYTENGLVTADGDSISSVTFSSLGSGVSAGVGNYALSAAVTGQRLSNYNITYINGALTVDPATLTITATNQSKTYGQTANLGTTAFTETGLVTANGDSINGVTLASPGVAATATVAGGPYAIVGSNAQGAGLRNYTITYSNGALTVSPATLTYTANSASMIYGGSTPSLTGNVTGFVNGETLVTATTGALGFGSPANATSNVGGYAITGTGLTANNGNYVFVQASGNSAALTVNPATLTYVANAAGMTYGGSTPALTGSVTGFVNGQTLASATAGALGFSSPANATRNVGIYAVTGSGLVANNGNYVFTEAAGNATALTVNPATLTYVANTANMTYGGSTPSLSGSVTGFVNDQTQSSATTGALAFGTPANAASNVGNYAIAGAGLAANNGNYIFVQASSNATALTVNPATLTYVADSFIEPAGAPFPTFTGSVTGFVNSQTETTATTGTLSFTTLATPLSPLGTYAINGSGLTANNGNYVFAQATGNATALTLQQSQSDAPSQFSASTNGPTTNTANINFNFQSPTGAPNIGFGPNTGASGGPIHIAFTPNAPVNRNIASNQANVYPSALPGGQAFTHNHGLDFEPISQYDANQYSKFKLPDYDDRDGLSTIFTIVARALSHGHASDYLIDNFWNGADPTWPAGKNLKLLEKAVSFTDGAGHVGTPITGPAFPIVAGQTDFAALLKNGPVMLVGPTSQKPGEWLLALGLTADGKDIVGDDPITGKLVELSYDSSTHALGGVTEIFDPKTKAFVPLADNNVLTPNGGNGLYVLKNFTPSGYYVVGFQPPAQVRTLTEYRHSAALDGAMRDAQ